MTTRRAAAWAAGCAFVAGVLAAADASSTRFWQVASQADLLRGEAENIAIDADGRMTLGPAAERVHEASAPFLWSLAQAGGALWIGSGDGGSVLRLAADGSVSTVLEAAQHSVHTVAPDGAGNLLAGTSPDGALHRLGSGAPEVIFDPPERYIWAVLAAESGDTYVATGDPGRIYRLPPDGEPQRLYDAEATHVRALALDADGELLAATGTPARVLRVSSDGSAFALLETAYGEIRALRRGPDGALYAVAAGSSTTSAAPARAAPEPASQPTARVTTTTTVTAVGAAPPVASPPPASAAASAPAASGPARGAVYRMTADGAWDIVWESQRDTPYDVRVDAGAGLIIATGNRGRIYRVHDDPPRTALLARAPAEQVTALAPGGDGSSYYATSNPGAVWRLSGQPAEAGNYVSEVHDAQTLAAWGALHWRALTPPDGTVRLFSRSGNTAAPNAAWSAWSEAYTDPEGAQITSPGARYLQWKAELEAGADSPTLLSVTAAYLPRNQRPRIESLTVHDAGVAFQQPFASGDPPLIGLDDPAAGDGEADSSGGGSGARQASLGRRVQRRGLRTIQWSASDPNADELRFDLQYRAQTETTWRTLRSDFADLVFTWDTRSAADGAYVVRVVATDAASNAPGAALIGIAESTPFDVDNAPPRITVESVDITGDTATVELRVDDAHAGVRRVEYSLDTARWRLLFPLDGITDSRSERFRFNVPAGSVDRLTVRVADAMHNITNAAVR